jgi:hypothetical protein
MRPVNAVLAGFFLVATCADAQPQPPAVLFGISTPTQITGYERFEIQTEGGGRVIMSAPYGKPPRSWGPLIVKQDGALEFNWAGDQNVLCALRRIDDRNYEGACTSPGQKERPLILARWNEPKDGLDLPVSDTDLRILTKARQLLSGPSAWNRRDDRVCEDDAKLQSWSVFCALYQASVSVAGEYLHARPVMTEARAALAKVTKGRPFQHPIMDYNNLESTTYADITTIFDLTERQLQAKKSP